MNSNPYHPPPLVSVIIPFHNDLAYLNEALQSCFNNTYTHLEILIIDDFSKIPLELKHLTIPRDKYPISIHRNTSNRGPGYSRNIGIKMANGDYIAFLDADDIWLPEIIEKQMKIFLKDSETAWVYTDGYYLVNNKIHRRPNSYYHGFKKGGFPSGKEVNEFHLRGYNYLTFSSNMFKKTALLEVGLFNENLTVSEDWDLFVRMAERFPSGIKAVNEPLMIYRVNNAGRHFVNRGDYLRVNIKILEDMYKRQGLLSSRSKTFNEAVAAIYQRAGIQRLNAEENTAAREFLFHPKCKPLNFQLRMIALRILSFLPNIFYKLALKLYDLSHKPGKIG